MSEQIRREVVFGVNADTGNAERNINTVDDAIRNTGKSTQTLRRQLRDMTNELQGLEPGTRRFNELTVAAGRLRDTIRDTNAVINATAGSAAENLGSGLAKSAQIGIGAFQGLASAQALFGTESEALNETLVRLQALAGLSSAIESLGGLGDKLTEIKASFMAAFQNSGLFTASIEANTVATEVNAVVAGENLAVTEADIIATEARTIAEVESTAATEGATVAQRIFNAVLNANPLVLIISALAGAAIAFAAFSSSGEEAVDISEQVREANLDAAKAVNKEKGELDLYLAVARNEKISKEERLKAIKNINAESPEYLGNITLENINTKESVRAIESYITSLDKKAKAQAFQTQLVKAYEKEVEIQNKASEEFASFTDKVGNDVKAQFEEIGKGNVASLFGPDIKTAQNAANRQAQRNEVVRDKELSQQKRVTQAIKDQITSLIEKGDIDGGVSDKAAAIAAKEAAAIEEANKKAVERSNKARDDRKNASKELASSAKKLSDDEELELAASETRKLEIVAERQKQELDAQFEKSSKSTQDAINLANAKLDIDEKLARDIKVIDDKTAADKKVIDDKILADKQATADAIKQVLQSEEQNEIDESNKKYDELIANANKYGLDSEELISKQLQAEQEIRSKYDDEETKQAEEQAKKRTDLEKQVGNAKLNLASDALGAISQIADAFAQNDVKRAKVAFNINKAASIGQALIATYLGAQNIFASAAANPETILFPAQPFITAGIAVASGLANVAKIASTQFNSSSSGGGGISSAPSSNVNFSSSQINENSLFSNGGNPNELIQSKEQTSTIPSINVNASINVTDINNANNNIAQTNQITKLGG